MDVIAYALAQRITAQVGTNTEIKTSMPTPVHCGAVFVLAEGGKPYGYISGGFNAGSTSGSLAITQKYDPETDTWSMKASIPDDLVNPTGFTLKDANNKDFGFVVEDDIAAMRMYNYSTNTWSSKATPQYSMVVGAGLVINNTFYGNSADTVSGGETMKYQLGTNTWSTLSYVMPEILARTQCFVIDNLGYVAGGFISGSDIKQTLYQFSPTSGWSTKATMPYTVYAGAGFALGGKGYVAGGLVASATPTNKLCRYDKQSNIWTNNVAILTAAKAHLSSFVLNGRAYIIGALDVTDNYNEMYPPDAAILYRKPFIDWALMNGENEAAQIAKAITYDSAQGKLVGKNTLLGICAAL